MNIGIIRTTSLDGPILPEAMAGALYMNENQAHQFAVSCTKGGQSVTLTGSVSGRFIRADGETVLLTGSVSGGVAYVTLPQACYVVPGRFIMAIFNTAGGATTTIYAATGNIARTQTGAIVDPGKVVPSIDDLLAEIEAMRTATAAANAAATGALANFAGAFSPSADYTAGQYVTYTDGSLYRFTAAHDAGPWDSTQVTKATAGGELADLKSALSERITNADFFEINEYPLAGVYYGTIGSSTTLQVRAKTGSYNGVIVPIPRGIQTIDLSDMAPYSVYAFESYPYIGMTTGVSMTPVSRILPIPVDNAYRFILVTLRLSDAGNEKTVFSVRMNRTVDKRLETIEYKITPIVNGKTLPIVCFIYDDNTTGDTTLHDMLEEYGLKGTFASIGNVDKNDNAWHETATRLQEWVREGHGVLGHGLTKGIDVSVLDGGSLAGISNISDADARKAIEANNAALDDFNLPHNGIAYWNVWEDNPHTRTIVEKYYNYGFTFGGSGAGVNTSMTDPFRLTRWTTDAASHMPDAEALVNESIGQNCILAFGGHMNRTGTGNGSYSTMAQFRSLLKLVAEYVRNGHMLCLNTDEAVKLFFGNKARTGILKSYPYRPSVGDMVYDDGLKICTKSGRSPFYRLTLSGTPQAGKIEISGLGVNVETSASDTVTDIINKIVAMVYSEYTLERTSATQIFFYGDRSGVGETPAVVTNTSGLSVTISQRQVGIDPTWASN